MHERLRSLDPQAAARIEPGNARRTIRALEVIELTGRPFSANDSWDRYESRYELAVAGLTRDRADLYTRVAQRVSEMLAQGVIQEARALKSRLGTTARQALGYKQILDSPDDPSETIEEAIVRATKRFARRQESWFRGDPRIHWFDASAAGLRDSLKAYFTEVLALP